MVDQQYLTPAEEEILLLESAERGYPFPVKGPRSVIAGRRGSDNENLRWLGKNLPQDFYKRHSALKAITAKAVDRVRHDDEIYDKTVDWFALMGRELHDGIQANICTTCTR